MIVYTWNGKEIKELTGFVKETDKFFIRSDGRRDVKVTSYSFMSQDREEVINWVINKEKRVVDNLNEKLNSFEDRKKQELASIHSQLERAELSLEKTIQKFKGE